MMTPEGRLKKEIDKFLYRLPKCYIFKPVQMGIGVRTVDYLCAIDGRFVGIEVKAPGQTPRKLQERCLQHIISAGGAAFWCDSFQSFLMNMTVWGLIKPNGGDRLQKRRFKKPHAGFDCNNTPGSEGSDGSPF